MKTIAVPLCLTFLALAACDSQPSFPPVDSPSAGIGQVTPQAPVAAPPPATAAAIATCAGTDILNLVGQNVSKLPATGPWTTVRILKPGTAATMDYSPTRLNVNVNNAGKVLSVSCG